MSYAIIISLVSIIVSIICVIFLIKLNGRCRSQLETIDSQNSAISSLNQSFKNFKEELNEIRSGSYGVSNRVKELIQQVDELQIAQQNLMEQDPQSRYYSKGAKLISQGASLEEVMRECEIPAAEAELLFNLHNKHK